MNGTASIKLEWMELLQCYQFIVLQAPPSEASMTKFIFYLIWGEAADNVIDQVKLDITYNSSSQLG